MADKRCLCCHDLGVFTANTPTVTQGNIVARGRRIHELNVGIDTIDCDGKQPLGHFFADKTAPGLLAGCVMNVASLDPGFHDVKSAVEIPRSRSMFNVGGSRCP